MKSYEMTNLMFGIGMAGRANWQVCVHRRAEKGREDFVCPAEELKKEETPRACNIPMLRRATRYRPLDKEFGNEVLRPCHRPALSQLNW